MNGASALIAISVPVAASLGAEQARQTAKQRPTIPEAEKSDASAEQKSFSSSGQDSGSQTLVNAQAQYSQGELVTLLGDNGGGRGGSSKFEDERESDQVSPDTGESAGSETGSAESAGNAVYARSTNSEASFAGIPGRYNSIIPNQNLGSHVDVLG